VLFLDSPDPIHLVWMVKKVGSLDPLIVYVAFWIASSLFNYDIDGGQREQAV